MSINHFMLSHLLHTRLIHLGLTQNHIRSPEKQRASEVVEMEKMILRYFTDDPLHTSSAGQKFWRATGLLTYTGASCNRLLRLPL